MKPNNSPKEDSSNLFGIPRYAGWIVVGILILISALLVKEEDLFQFIFLALVISLYFLFRPKFKGYLFALKDISKRIWYIYIIIIIGGLAFTLPSQAADLFQSFIFGTLDLYLLGFTAALLLWSIIIWVVCRNTLLLLPATVDRNNQQADHKLTEHSSDPYGWWARVLPPFLGSMPYLITALGFWYAWLDEECWTIVAFIGVYLGLAIATFIFIRWWEGKKLSSPFYTNKEGEFGDIDRFYRRAYLLGILISGLFFLLFLPGISLHTSTILGPPVIVILGLMTATLILATLNYLDYRTRSPLIVIVVILCILFSMINNNHEIRTLDNSSVEDRPELTTYIKRWIENKSEASPQRDSIPLIIVAAEGGGIRALNWTAGVLKKLDDSLPGFYDHVFAISSVSGGSVGALLYHTFQADFPNSREQLDEGFQCLIEGDYLSNVTAGLMYPEVLQTILPFQVEPFDRARYLEDAWAHKYLNATDLHTLDSSYLQLWEYDSDYTPRLFINSALAETGQKVVLSSLQFDSTYFPDVIDFFQETGKGVPIKVAASVGARFPYITSAATITNTEGKKSGNLVDGGYYENTGMGTAIQLMNAVTGVMDSIKNDEGYKPVKLMLIFIQNGDYSARERKNPDFMIDFVAPPKAFLNTWGRQSVSVDETTEELSEKLRYPINYQKFELARESDGELVLPLGWYISDTARAVFREQIQQITVESDTGNYSSFQAVKSFLAE